MSFDRNDVALLGSDLVYRGFHQIRKLRLKHRLYRGGWSEAMDREVSVRNGAAAAIVYDPVLDAVLLVEQFRAPIFDAGGKPWSLEVVAGMLDKQGESPEALIRRELEEEAGIVPYGLEKVTSYWVSPGGSSSCMHLFVALADLSAAGGVFGVASEHEDIHAIVLPRAGLLQSMLAQENGNGATLIGMFWLEANAQRLQGLTQNVRVEA